MTTHARSCSDFLLEAICRCNAAADIIFTAVMSVKGVKFIPTIRALFYDSDTLSIFLIHEVVLGYLMDLTCVSLEVGAT